MVVLPVMGVMRGLLALLSWLAVKGATARDVYRRGWRSVQRWRRTSWLATCMDCGGEDEKE